MAAAMLLAASTVAQPVSATPTDNTRTVGTDSFTQRHVCTDPIRVDTTWDEMVHTYYDKAGDATRMSFTGTVNVTFTDVVTGAAYSPTSSGPSTYDLATGQSWLRGGNAVVINDDGVVVSTTGRIVYDADFNIISIVGHQQPVCAALGTESP